MFSKVTTLFKIASVSKASSRGTQQIFYYPINTFASQPSSKVQQSHNQAQPNIQRDSDAQLNINAEPVLQRGDMAGLRKELDPSTRGQSKTCQVQEEGGLERGDLKGIQGDQSLNKQPNFDATNLGEDIGVAKRMERTTGGLSGKINTPGIESNNLGNIEGAERMEDTPGLSGKVNAPGMEDTPGLSGKVNAPGMQSGRRSFTTRKDVRPAEEQEKDDTEKQIHRFINESPSAERFTDEADLGQSQNTNQSQGQTQNKGHSWSHSSRPIETGENVQQQEPSNLKQSSTTVGQDLSGENITKGTSWSHSAKPTEFVNMDETFEESLLRKAADKVSETVNRVKGKKE